MRSKTQNIGAWRIARPVLTAAIVCASGRLSYAAPQSKQKAAQPAQKAFATPEQAAQALIQAAENYDVPALLEILGPDGQDLVASEDPVEDKNRAAAFAALAREKSPSSMDSKNRTAPTSWSGMTIGRFRFRSSSEDGNWYYDSKAGRTGDPVPAHRRERTGRHPDLPWFRGGATRVRFGQARWLRREPVRTANHQHAWQARRSCLAEPGRKLGTAPSARQSRRLWSKAT